MQNKLHVFVRHSRVFPCLSRLLLPSFLFFLSHQTSATKDLGAHSYIGPRQVCAAEQDMGYSVLS